MLRIEVPSAELYIESERRFVKTKPTTLSLEHSLVSLSKWEAKYKKPFLSKTEKTPAELLEYIKCMTITQNVNPLVYYALDDNTLAQIIEYIEDGHTATWFTNLDKPKGNQMTVTSEVIYYWMSSMGIDKECEKWHLSRLMTYIRVHSEMNKPEDKKKGRKNLNDIYARNAALNKKRREQTGSKG